MLNRRDFLTAAVAAVPTLNLTAAPVKSALGSEKNVSPAAQGGITDEEFIAFVANQLDYIPLADKITRVINGCAFATALKTVNLPGCLAVGPNAFQGCSNLTSVELPVCTYLGNACFQQCTKLNEVKIPALKTLPYQGFYVCTALETIYADSLTTINDIAFQSCENLTNIYCPNLTTLNSRSFGYLGGQKNDVTFHCNNRTTTQILAMSLKDHFGNTPKSVWTKFHFVGSDGNVEYDSANDQWVAQSN